MTKAKRLRQPVFVMLNNHVKSCGVPPCISNKDLGDQHAYHYGYFENEQ